MYGTCALTFCLTAFAQMFHQLGCVVLAGEKKKTHREQVLEDCGGKCVSFMGCGVVKYLFKVVHS